VIPAGAQEPNGTGRGHDEERPTDRVQQQVVARHHDRDQHEGRIEDAEQLERTASIGHDQRGARR